METVSSANAGIINIQITGVSPDDTIAITLNDDYDVPVGITDITSHGGTVSTEESSGSFFITKLLVKMLVSYCQPLEIRSIR